MVHFCFCFVPNQSPVAQTFVSKSEIQIAGLSSEDAAFLLTIGSFLLTVELLCLQFCFRAFFAYTWSFLLTI